MSYMTMNAPMTVKWMNTREDIVKATAEDKVCFVLDMSGKEDDFYHSFKSEGCFKFKKANRYSEKGYLGISQECIIYRDAHNDGKPRILFHSEICGIKASFTVADVLNRVDKSKQKYVEAGSEVTIVIKLPKTALVGTFKILGVGVNNDDVLIGEADAVNIGLVAWNVYDQQKA